MKMSKEVREAFREFGRQGGKLGGKIRAEKLSPERRSEIARAAVAEREAKKRAKILAGNG